MKIKRALLYLQRILPESEKPNPVSSLRICWYLLEHLKFDRVWHAFDPAPDPLPQIDELWFVCSSWAYLDDAFRQQTLKVFPLAKKVIWCNNDWNVPFHGYHLGRVRETARLAALTIVPELAERFGVAETFNWNRLTFNPLAAQTPYKERVERIYYYGSYRVDRLRCFDKYFPAWGNRFTISAANGKDAKRFSDRYPTIEVLKRMENVFTALDRYTVTVMLEDRYSHAHPTAPPNRFYEALSAGTAIFFEPEAVENWAGYGYDIRKFLIPENPVEMLDAAPRVARAQRKWCRPYMRELDADFKKALAKLASNEIGRRGPPANAKRYL